MKPFLGSQGPKVVLMDTANGIFCIETAQWNRAKSPQPTVRPLLRLLAATQGAACIHRHFSTWEELQLLLRLSTHRRYEAYPILYLVCHGEARRISLRGKGSKDHCGRGITLTELADPLRGRASNKVIFFSACGFMKGREAELRAFVDETGVQAIMGYERDVGWIESAQLELGLLASLTQRPLKNLKSVHAAVRTLRSTRDLMKELEFRMSPSAGA